MCVPVSGIHAWSIFLFFLNQKQSGVKSHKRTVHL